MAHKAAVVSLTRHKTDQLGETLGDCPAGYPHTLDRSRVFFERVRVAITAPLRPLLHWQMVSIYLSVYVI